MCVFGRGRAGSSVDLRGLMHGERREYNAALSEGGVVFLVVWFVADGSAGGAYGSGMASRAQYTPGFGGMRNAGATPVMGGTLLSPMRSSGVGRML